VPVFDFRPPAGYGHSHSIASASALIIGGIDLISMR
jgi:hypothetical protein